MSESGSSDPETPATIDGRRRRGEYNRARIVAALLELIRDGEYAPSAEQVAVRADVSLRTVFRHFEDMESLYREMVVPIEETLRQVAAKPFTATDWRGRLIEMVERRSGAYEVLAPFRRAADVQRHKSPGLEAETLRFARMARGIVVMTLPEDKREGDLIEALDVLLGFETWMRLRREQGLSIRRARAVLETTILTLTA